MARNCPDCSIEMYIETVRDVQLDVCPECAGTWFDPEELRILLARDPLVLGVVEDMAIPAVEHKAAGPSLRHCPACEFPLEQYHYLYTSPVVVEACLDCGGMWVEDGELNRMQEWLEETHHPMSVKEKASLAVAEAMLDHDKQMKRQQILLRFFSMLQRHRPGWTSLFIGKS